MKLKCDHRSCNHNLSNCNILARKNYSGFQRDSNARPLAALALQFSANWAVKTHMLRADQFIEFTFTRDRNETNLSNCKF